MTDQTYLEKTGAVAAGEALPTYADDYPDAQGKDCEACRRVHPAWAIVRVDNLWVCGHCLIDVNRELEVRVIYPDKDWRSGKGEAMRYERNRLLDYWRWTIMPDSPLSLSCQGEFQTYLKSLHRMTVDFPDATAWVWPDVPALVYAEA